MEDEGGVTESRNGELHPWNIQGHQMEGEGGVT